MNETPATSDVIVVGGGLAGLTAANVLADGGAEVVLVEATSGLGGRASTDEREGHLLNRGAHALYERGAAMAVLASLGIDPPGGDAPTRGALGVRDGRPRRLPVGPVSLLRSPLLDWRGRLELGRLLVGVDRLDPASAAGESTSRWIESVVTTRAARDLLAALVRLSSYSGDHDSMSAEVAITQLQLANGGVRYLDGGWQALADVLAERARRRGVDLVVGSPVRAVERQSDHWLVRTDGSGIAAPQVLLAVSDPSVAARLGGSEELTAAAEHATAATVSCLDVGLASLPDPGATFALGIDEPTYMSVHSGVADLGTGATLHVMRYGARRGSDTAELRAEMETALGRIQPGWQEVTDVARFLPFHDACSAVAAPGSGGFAGRHPVVVGDRDRMYVAGDWVGPVGHLSDASFASARSAAEQILAAHRRNAR